MGMAKKTAVNSFFNDFFQTFSIEDEKGGSSFIEAEIPSVEAKEDSVTEAAEMEFSTEDFAALIPESIPEPSPEETVETEKETVNEAESSIDLQESNVEDAKAEDEPVPKLRQFPKQLEEQTCSFKDEKGLEEQALEQDFKQMSSDEVEEAVRPFTIDLLEKNFELLETDREENVTAEDRFAIMDDKVANWALKKIHREQREYLRLKELGEAEIEDIKERLRKVEKKFENSTKYLKSLLQEYFMKIPDKKNTTTQETYNLLNGKLVMKKASTNYDHDDKVVLDFLKENGLNQFIKLEETVKWGQLKKHIEDDGNDVVLKDTGERVDGVSIKETPAKFNVKFED